MILMPRGLAVALVFGVSGSVGCSSVSVAEAEQEATGRSTCKIFNTRTGKPLAAAELAQLDDPVAKKILEGNACPETFTRALEKAAVKPGSFLVSETAAFQTAAEAASSGFRTVVTDLNESRANNLLFSGAANANGVSETSVEMIGKDATTGVFNFYELLPGGQWVFYGNSRDFIENGYDCTPTGYCVSKSSVRPAPGSPTSKACASCHVSGGLIMKELASPWLHWTPGFPNGSRDVVGANPTTLGTQQPGQRLEVEVVRASFGEYNDRRVQILAAKGVAELLRPLFCTIDINLTSRYLGATLLVDSEVTFGFLTSERADNETYRELKREVRQRIQRIPNADDTESPFTYPSRGEIDTSYGNALERAKLVDAELVQDILNVDFTRPIFSGQRCGLVNAISGKTGALDGKLATYAVESDSAKKEALAIEIAAGIPAVFAEALAGKTGVAEKRFLTNLTDVTETAEAHRRQANHFFEVCRERLSGPEKKAAMKEIMTYASHVRAVMRRDVVGKNGQDLLEGRGRDDKMVIDDIADNPNAFDPATCRPTLN
jgi:hypothetical protein